MNWFFVVITAGSLFFSGPMELGECEGREQAKRFEISQWNAPSRPEYDAGRAPTLGCLTKKQLTQLLFPTPDKIADADIEVGF